MAVVIAFLDNVYIILNTVIMVALAESVILLQDAHLIAKATHVEWIQYVVLKIAVLAIQPVTCKT